MKAAICISDDSSSDSQIQVMTAEEIKNFKSNSRSKSKNKKQKEKEKEKKKKEKKAENKKQKNQKKGTSSKEKKEKNMSNKQKDICQIPVLEKKEDRWNKQVKDTDLHKFGNAVLIKTNGKSPLRNFPAHVKDSLRVGVTWWISGEDYESQNWSQVFSNMYEMNARDLRIIQSTYPTVIKEIHHIRFDCLQILYLYENNIKSIELLSRLRVPQIKDLSLRDNLITKIAPLGRMGLEMLQNLDISKNPILDITSLCHINSISLKMLLIEVKHSSVMEEDIGWLVRMKKAPNKFLTMESIVIQSKNRIRQRKVDEMLGYKYNKDGKQLIKRRMS